MVEVKSRIRMRRYETQAEGYLELGMPEHALEVLSRLNHATNFSSHVLYLKGEALRALELYEEAIVSLNQAALLNPQDVRLWLAIGWCRKRTGRLDLAIEAIQQAVEIDADDALSQYNLACYLSLAGEKKQTLEHLATAFKIEPGFRALVATEPDFDPMRNDADFQTLVATDA